MLIPVLWKEKLKYRGQHLAHHHTAWIQGYSILKIFCTVLYLFVYGCGSSICGESDDDLGELFSLSIICSLSISRRSSGVATVLFRGRAFLPARILFILLFWDRVSQQVALAALKFTV